MNLQTISLIGEVARYVFDGIIVITLLLALLIGGRRSFRKSLSNFIVYLSSIIVAVIAGNIIASSVTGTVTERIFLLFIPDRFASLTTNITPLINSISTTVIFIISTMIIFVIVKIIFSLIAKKFNLAENLFTKYKTTSIVNCTLSIFITILSTYAHLLLVISILAFPFFNIVREGSISQNLLNMTPFVANRVEEMFQPFTTIQIATNLMGIATDGNSGANTQIIAEQIVSNPAVVTQIIENLPDEAVIQANQVLAEHGLTQDAAIEQLGDMIESGEVTQEQIQAMLDAHLP